MDIKFNTQYKKFPRCCLDDYTKTEDTTLLQAIPVWREDLTDDFLQYDTEIQGEHASCHPIPDGKLILLLLHNSHGLWTSLRRYTEQDYVKYKRWESRKVRIKIK